MIYLGTIKWNRYPVVGQPILKNTYPKWKTDITKENKRDIQKLKPSENVWFG